MVFGCDAVGGGGGGKIGCVVFGMACRPTGFSTPAERGARSLCIRTSSVMVTEELIRRGAPCGVRFVRPLRNGRLRCRRGGPSFGVARFGM